MATNSKAVINGMQASYGPLEDFKKWEAVLFNEKQNQYLSEMEVEVANPFSNEFGFPQGDRAKEGVQLLKEHPQHQQPFT